MNSMTTRKKVKLTPLAQAVDPKTLQAESLARVALAMEAVQRAQDELGTACANLSALCYGYKLQTETSKLYDKVRAHWYRLQDFRSSGRYVLDDTNIEALLERQAARRPRIDLAEWIQISHVYVKTRSISLASKVCLQAGRDGSHTGTILGCEFITADLFRALLNIQERAQRHAAHRI